MAPKNSLRDGQGASQAPQRGIGGRPWCVALLLLMAGCGTTRVTDTTRTATEQLLVSNSIDQTVSEMDFRALSGKPVYFDPQYLEGVTDRGYLIGSLLQQLLACGCLLQEDKSKAAYVVVARSGAVGTDRNDLLFGVPQLNVPSLIPGQPGGMIPELPLAKKTDKKGVAKIAVFVYNRNTGRPVWQSGVVQAVSTAKDSWLLGAGPFENGTIREGTEMDGLPIQIPLDREEAPSATSGALIPVTHRAVWTEPEASASSGQVVRQPAAPSPPPSVEQSSFKIRDTAVKQASAPPPIPMQQP